MPNLWSDSEFIIEYPKPPATLPWYGLWCPLLDCFILVSYDYKKLRKTQALTVSKLVTVLVQLDPKLYHDNVIDNSCATNWTLSDSESVNFTLVLKKEFHADKIHEVQPSNLQDPTQAEHMVAWFKFVWFCLNYLNGSLHPTDDFTDLVSFTFDTQSTNISKEIYKILYLETDLNQAQVEVKKIMDRVSSSYV